ncbi:GILT-like protein 1 [Aphis craccivora]|uniref:GILT-like protein 1 n=1 Tax=Aphis craccivora TaxID=307492 RepID=A0A6G0ZGN5_APHCR|nr:GILT-like protein 1 [Aphis craccivora]
MICPRPAFTFCRQTPVFEARTNTAALQDHRYLSFVLPSSRFPILSERCISTDCLVNKFTFVNFELHRTFCAVNWKIMENRARNTFVLLTIVFAFALQCISAADFNSPSTSPASVNPASVSPASVNPAQDPAHVDMSADHTENIAKTAPHVSNNDSSVSER